MPLVHLHRYGHTGMCSTEGVTYRIPLRSIEEDFIAISHARGVVSGELWRWMYMALTAFPFPPDLPVTWNLPTHLLARCPESGLIIKNVTRVTSV